MNEPKREESQKEGLGMRILDAVDLAQAVGVVADMGQAGVDAAGGLLSAVSELVDI